MERVERGESGESEGANKRMQHVIISICNWSYREEEKGMRVDEKRGQGEEEGRWR